MTETVAVMEDRRQTVLSQGSPDSGAASVDAIAPSPDAINTVPATSQLPAPEAAPAPRDVGICGAAGIGHLPKAGN